MDEILFVESIKGSAHIAVREINALGWADKVITMFESSNFTLVILRVNRQWLIEHGRS